MKTQNQKTLTAKNQLLWISIFFAISISVNSEEKNSAEFHYQTAMEAYEGNNCSTTIEHFEQYLAKAKVEQKKKISIESAIEWCREYVSTYVSTSNFHGILAPGTAKRHELREIKPEVKNTL